tara:strand:+ start:358 stop:567 length:210 start_codon:yes stop_codon:yes gene_type:complete
MTIYTDSETINAATGRDLMLRSAFLEEISTIKARQELGTFGSDPNGAKILISYLESRINEIDSMNNAKL